MTPTNTDTEKGRGMGEILADIQKLNEVASMIIGQNPSVYEQLMQDIRFYGSALIKRNADGTFERVDPCTVYAPFAAVHPTPSDTQEQG